MLTVEQHGALAPAHLPRRSGFDFLGGAARDRRSPARRGPAGSTPPAPARRTWDVRRRYDTARRLRKPARPPARGAVRTPALVLTMTLRGVQALPPCVPLPPRRRRSGSPRPSRPPRAPRSSGWPEIQAGRSTLVFAPTGSGKTLAAFLAAIDRLMFAPVPRKDERCRVVYVSPLRALAVDVERNLRAPLAGIARAARRRGDACTCPTSASAPGTRPRPSARACSASRPTS